MITHFDAIALQKHREVEIGRISRLQQLKAMIEPMPKQSRKELAGTAITSLVALARGRTANPQPAGQC